MSKEIEKEWLSKADHRIKNAQKILENRKRNKIKSLENRLIALQQRVPFELKQS
ncbi:hypothetical protein [Neobacillus vireti]|uniref:hypothetical protein n=1 Tax=Neobacillus vireti TaxID=220686 RepID=UPI0004117F2F|nr:hypothetical protein [Neobacillus vireti]